MLNENGLYNIHINEEKKRVYVKFTKCNISENDSMIQLAGDLDESLAKIEKGSTLLTDYSLLQKNGSSLNTLMEISQKTSKFRNTKKIAQVISKDIQINESDKYKTFTSIKEAEDWLDQ
jgi:cell division protein ZapA (FtsZ GTPase activity inhibitor)